MAIVIGLCMTHRWLMVFSHSTVEISDLCAPSGQLLSLLLCDYINPHSYRPQLHDKEKPFSLPAWTCGMICGWLWRALVLSDGYF
ncbi:hypothetical protein PBY51_010339 [Eleginops maclovinus]|uniref:Uncharacterized protein n=1 Tax=Eleginops maclovinus TaxID=56733 RepID=A0AAN7X8L9_ELEMC|nr:hypothetical protein PBY51_010339 [Eleginops maclovinus]